MGWQKRRPSVVLADDHAGTLWATSAIMSPEFEVLAVVANGTKALEAVKTLHPDVVVLDIAMPEADGFETARRIRDLDLPTRIIFLTIAEDSDYASAASRMGASYVLKRRIQTDLIPAVHDTLEGRLFLSPLAQVDRRGPASEDSKD